MLLTIGLRAIDHRQRCRGDNQALLDGHGLKDVVDHRLGRGEFSWVGVSASGPFLDDATNLRKVSYLESA